MAIYIIKGTSIRKGHKNFGPGESIELAEDETRGLEQFLDLAPEQPTIAKQLNAVDTITLVNAAQDLAELDQLAQDENRKTVTAAIDIRRATLGLLASIDSAESDEALDTLAADQTNKEILDAIQVRRSNIKR